jgi:hypothetical protein
MIWFCIVFYDIVSTPGSGREIGANHLLAAISPSGCFQAFLLYFLGIFFICVHALIERHAYHCSWVPLSSSDSDFRHLLLLGVNFIPVLARELRMINVWSTENFLPDPYRNVAATS